MNSYPSLQVSRRSRLFTAFLLLSSIFLANLPTTAKASDWDEFNMYLSNGIMLSVYGVNGSSGFTEDFFDYWNVLNSDNNHKASSQATRNAERRAAQSGWFTIYSLYQATVNKQYTYEEFRQDGTVMEFLRRIYRRVPSSYTETHNVQVPDGKGGTMDQLISSQETDPAPRYVFGGTLETVPVSSDCKVKIDQNSDTDELGLALRYQTLTIIYTAIANNFFSEATDTIEKATKALQGNIETNSDTPGAQVFQESVLPFLQTVMQDPFCPTNADFARGIICVALKKGILPEGSVDIDCEQEIDLSKMLGCTPPAL